MGITRTAERLRPGPAALTGRRGVATGPERALGIPALEAAERQEGTPGSRPSLKASVHGHANIDQYDARRPTG